MRSGCATLKSSARAPSGLPRGATPGVVLQVFSGVAASHHSRPLMTPNFGKGLGSLLSNSGSSAAAPLTRAGSLYGVNWRTCCPLPMRAEPEVQTRFPADCEEKRYPGFLKRCGGTFAGVLPPSPLSSSLFPPGSGC